MGRYYNGDIDGKFWFAVQSSAVGEQFGAYEQDAGYVKYEIHRDSYNDIIQTLRELRANMQYDRIQEFFNTNNGYNNQTLEEAGINKDEIKTYADYGFGQQVKKWFDDNPDEEYLNYEAEF